MLQPKKTKYRKQQKNVRHLKGVETRGCTLEFGEFGLRAMESGWITARQIEAARVAITRSGGKSAKVWIKVFPDKPITRKAAETRQGSGKGAPEFWVAEVRAGRLLYEVTGITKATAVAAMALGAAKLPVKTKLVTRSSTLV